MQSLKVLIFISILIVLNSNGWAKETQKKVILMTFNVENLFDTDHDEGKEDYTFLPLSLKKAKNYNKQCRKIKRESWKQECLNLDWSKETLSLKLKALGETVLKVNNGIGPDLIVLQEVENIKVLKQLRDEYLKPAHYLEPVLLEGGDIRGIDVALMTRLPIKGQPKLHNIYFKSINNEQKLDTRGILDVSVILPDDQKSILRILGVHFPAPFHPANLRVDALRALNYLEQESKNLIVAMGDMNIPVEESKSNKEIQKELQQWIVADEYCKHCKGTAYYPPKKSWSFLDKILVSKKFLDKKSKWKWNEKSVRVENGYLEQIKKDGTPNSFDSKTGKGVSDHCPLSIELEMTH